MQVSDVLRAKGADVATIDPDALVTALLERLAQYRIGAMVVAKDGGAVEGIVSERDVVRRLHRDGSTLLETRVAQIMTPDVVTCTPSDDVQDLLVLMTERRFRHLPVLDDGHLAGIVSIGDIVKSRIEALVNERNQLEGYIAGN